MSRRMTFSLVSAGPPPHAHRVVVNGQPILVGRSPDVEVPVADRWASRHHCQIYQVDGTLMVRDVGSRHGTYVNGQLIDESELLPGDTLMVGMTIFQVEYRRKRSRNGFGDPLASRAAVERIG